MKGLVRAACAALVMGLFAAGQAAEAGTVKVSVDLTNQRMTVSENGQAIHSWAISSGRAGYRTVTGTFKPQWMARMHYSRKYDNSPMPNAIFFRGGFAIHGTYATGRLGSPASHGCIRLAPSNAKTLYNLVSRHGRENTTISVYGTARDRAYVARKQSTKRHAARNSDWQDTGYESRGSSKRPKVIYRNGQAYVYVGPAAARRYYSKQRYSGGYYNY
ncbi:MAG: L,D-transpeptidase [Hyphomicrobiaceae bacterium]|nr:L,D-transpeptidase [Hyphomicrobiaceae bacterium]